MATIFKIAEPSDAEMLVQFMREYCAFDQLPFEEENRHRTVAQFIQNSQLGRLWVIYAGEEPIGYLALTLGYSFEFGGYDAFVDEIYIRADYRGCGIGTLALQIAENACRTLHVRALHLEVERNNVNAQALYRKVGFVEHDRYLLTKRIAPRG